MAKESLYSETQVERLEKYEGLADKWVDLIDAQALEDVKNNKDFRKVRLLMEVISGSTESIHKAAANKAKAEATKSNEDVKALIAYSLRELATKKEALPQITDKDREEMMDAVIIPDDVVYGEDLQGVGYLSIGELEKSKDE